MIALEESVEDQLGFIQDIWETRPEGHLKSLGTAALPCSQARAQSQAEQKEPAADVADKDEDS